MVDTIASFKFVRFIVNTIVRNMVSIKDQEIHTMGDFAYFSIPKAYMKNGVLALGIHYNLDIEEMPKEEAAQ
jgi:hypothetical protein